MLFRFFHLPKPKQFKFQPIYSKENKKKIDDYSENNTFRDKFRSVIKLHRRNRPKAYSSILIAVFIVLILIYLIFFI